jgi:polyphosphate kinase
MPRNLDARVELFFPIDDSLHVERIKALLDLQLNDTAKAHILRSDGTYRKPAKRSKGVVNSQQALYQEAKEAARKTEMALEQRLKPMYRKKD